MSSNLIAYLIAALGIIVSVTTAFGLPALAASLPSHPDAQRGLVEGESGPGQ